MPLNQQMMYDPTATTHLFLPPDLLVGPTADAPPADDQGPRQHAARRHRRERRRVTWQSDTVRSWWMRCASLMLAAAAAVLVAMLSVLGGLVSYEPLRDAASPGVPQQLIGWWPLLIFGPWLVASLSILRAALYQRHALHSWAVVVFFSGLAIALCMSQVPRTPTNLAVAGLPPLSALLAFHQIVRQVTLINPPRHALPRRHPARRRG
ncbi:DUF2637 domain-containing protein [Streptomyces sp. MP131-18]|uniref:DUF2637 domain-containing protein n=1 Tax=Streptomyces sp. MP131-18 TaxID=1857892 RepID=UPI0009A172F7|nr:DUF2637 domain-containing protein [Streptomyces sp. MP131-18]ONK11524.1 hypothetical protein STBA_22580 [Streptomyces sp. MP131-18]